MRRLPPRANDEEIFLWQGHNYLLKLGTDLAFLPLPILNDPLLLTWWHYEAPDYDRDDALVQPPYSLHLQSMFEEMIGRGEFLDATKRHVMADAAMRAEGDWWFDADRLHSDADKSRMAAATTAILREASHFPPPKATRMPLTDHAPMPESLPLNDLGREMEVLLYGHSGAFVEKLFAMRVYNKSATTLQCMIKLRAMKGRVSRRAHERRVKAASTLQRRWRNRHAANLGGMADLFANLALAANKDAKLEQQMEEEAARKVREREEAATMRTKVMRRRWGALRSCLKELKESMKAAVSIQCLVRTKQARRLMKIRARDKKMQLKDLDMDEAARGAYVLQYRLRTHQASTALLVDQYNRRVEWYHDSRILALVAPLAVVLAASRLNKRTEARTLRFELSALHAPPPAESVAALPIPLTHETKALQAEAQADASAARRLLMYCEGLVAAIDTLLIACSSVGYSLDVLTKSRKEAKRAVQVSLLLNLAPC